ncbi:MAG: DUF2288 domain-containing protein [Cellvibrionales bacterium]|nr:DUF2288 domain-containing protein [Cellvibrionales bacterium]
MVDIKSLTKDLNRQTAKIRWQELEKFFAMGVLVRVAPSLDLVKVAAEFANDNKPQIEQWLTDGCVIKAQDQDAIRWQTDNTLFWAVVIDPWVLIQEAS